MISSSEIGPSLPCVDGICFHDFTMSKSLLYFECWSGVSLAGEDGMAEGAGSTIGVFRGSEAPSRSDAATEEDWVSDGGWWMPSPSVISAIFFSIPSSGPAPSVTTWASGQPQLFFSRTGEPLSSPLNHVQLPTFSTGVREYRRWTSGVKGYRKAAFDTGIIPCLCCNHKLEVVNGWILLSAATMIKLTSDILYRMTR